MGREGRIGEGTGNDETSFTIDVIGKTWCSCFSFSRERREGKGETITPE